jgi:hypothetical protein
MKPPVSSKRHFTFKVLLALVSAGHCRFPRNQMATDGLSDKAPISAQNRLSARSRSNTSCSVTAFTTTHIREHSNTKGASGCLGARCRAPGFGLEHRHPRPRTCAERMRRDGRRACLSLAALVGIGTTRGVSHHLPTTRVLLRLGCDFVSCRHRLRITPPHVEPGGVWRLTETAQSSCRAATFVLPSGRNRMQQPPSEVALTRASGAVRRRS